MFQFIDLEPSKEAILRAIQTEMNDVISSSGSWESKYDRVFSNQISGKVFSLIRLDYCDPDTTYKEDVLAFASAFNQYMDENYPSDGQ